MAHVDPQHEAPNGAKWLSPESEPLMLGDGWAAIATADGTPAYEWVGPQPGDIPVPAPASWRARLQPLTDAPAQPIEAVTARVVAGPTPQYGTMIQLDADPHWRRGEPLVIVTVQHGDDDRIVLSTRQLQALAAVLQQMQAAGLPQRTGERGAA